MPIAWSCCETLRTGSSPGTGEGRNTEIPCGGAPGVAGEDPQGVGADGEWGARAGGPGSGIDHHSLANRRNEAYRSGDLERTVELSREPNVHLGPQMFAELPGEQDSLDPRRGPSSGSARVSRGGCWLIVARYCRSSFRYYDSPGYRYISLGFRLLRIVP